MAKRGRLVEIKCKGSKLLSIDELHPLQGNLKDLTEINYKKLKKEILDLGYSEPVSVWWSGDKWCLLNGHQRHRTLRMMRDEGFEIPPIPVSQIDANDLAEAKKKILAFTSQYGEMTGQGLYEFMSEAQIPMEEIKESFNFPDIDFEKFEEEFFKDPAGSVEGEDDVPRSRNTNIKTGELFSLGNHRLLCGDATDADSVQRLMNGEKADMVYTDPPYGIKRDKGFEGAGGFGGSGTPIKRRQYRDDWDSNRPAKEAFELILSLAPRVIIWGGNFFADLLPQGKHWLVWDKVNTMPTFGDCELAYTNIERTSVKQYTIQYNGLIGKEAERFHPTQKPVKLHEEIFKDYPAETIVDLYGGSGSTLIACEKQNKKCFMSEIDPQFCQVIIDRWEKFTGQKAVSLVSLKEIAKPILRKKQK